MRYYGKCETKVESTRYFDWNDFIIYRRTPEHLLFGFFAQGRPQKSPGRSENCQRGVALFKVVLMYFMRNMWLNGICFIQIGPLMAYIDKWVL